MHSHYIHIGMPKTGSSAIQAFLTINQEVLRNRGYIYPNPPKFTQAFQTSSGNASMLHRLIATNQLKAAYDLLRTYDQENKIILSSEVLFHTLRMYPERFFELFSPFRYKIICYVRRQDNLFSSVYNQIVKNQRVKMLKLQNIAATHDFSSVLENCLNYTDASNIIVRPYEKQQFAGNNIFEDFMNCLGLSIDDEFQYPEKIVNPSLDLYTLEYRRILNIFDLDKSRKDMFFINSLLASYTIKNNAGKPFMENNIFSRDERIEILEKHKEKNEFVAKTFLQRSDGKLFYEPLSDEVNESVRELTLDKALDISKFLLQHGINNRTSNEVINDIIEITIRGTAEKLIKANNITEFDNDVRSKQYELVRKPDILSEHILSFEKKSDIWFIQSTGDDPFFVIPDFNKINTPDKKLFIKITITSTVDTTLQLYYTSANKVFDEDHVLDSSIEKGYNEVVFMLDDGQTVSSLRLDPGVDPGIYLLHSFEVYI